MIKADLQVCGVFRDVWRDTGQFEVGAVHHGAFTATFLRTHKVLETLATQTATVVFLTCRKERDGGQRERERETQTSKKREGEKEKQNKINNRSRTEKEKGCKGKKKDKGRH